MFNIPAKDYPYAFKGNHKGGTRREPVRNICLPTPHAQKYLLLLLPPKAG
jgi:hypothetical protein